MTDVKAESVREKEYSTSSHNESLKNEGATGNADLDAIPDPDAVGFSCTEYALNKG